MSHYAFKRGFNGFGATMASLSTAALAPALLEPIPVLVSGSRSAPPSGNTATILPIAPAGAQPLTYLPFVMSTPGSVIVNAQAPAQLTAQLFYETPTAQPTAGLLPGKSGGGGGTPDACPAAFAQACQAIPAANGGPGVPSVVGGQSRCLFGGRTFVPDANCQPTLLAAAAAATSGGSAAMIGAAALAALLLLR